MTPACGGRSPGRAFSFILDAKTIWLFREQLTRSGAIERLFQRFDAVLRDAGYLAMGGQIVDATVIQARRPRLSKDEKATVKDGGVPAGWSKAKRAQMDTDGRWTLKRGRKRSPEHSGSHERSRSELVIPVFGYKNHLGIDRRHGFIRTFAVTDAAAHTAGSSASCSTGNRSKASQPVLTSPCGFSRYCAPFSMPTLDAESLALSVRESQAQH
jgi:hypothetical protein